MANTESAHLRSLGLPEASDEIRLTAGAPPDDDPMAPVAVAALPVAQAPTRTTEISEAIGSRREAGVNRGMKDFEVGTFDLALNDNRGILPHVKPDRLKIAPQARGSKVRFEYGWRTYLAAREFRHRSLRLRGGRATFAQWAQIVQRGST